MGVKESQKAIKDWTDQGRIDSHRVRTERKGYKMEQGEKMDTKKNQENENVRGQRTQAKPPPMRPVTQKLQPGCDGGGGAGY